MLLIPILACALSFPSPGHPAGRPAPAAPPVARLTPWISLGEANGAKLRATLLFQEPARESPRGRLTLRLKAEPMARPAGPERVRDVPLADQAWQSTACLRACRFSIAGRSQAVVTFMETRGDWRGTQVAILDYDGQQARRLYRRVGLQDAHAGQVRGLWRIAEDWEAGAYRRSPGRGAAENIGDGVVRRWLHWGGRGFVPDVPGRTQVVPARSTGLPSAYRYVPQRSVTFVRPWGRGIAGARVRVGPATTRADRDYGRTVAVDPTGRFLYCSEGSSSYVSQYRIRRNGSLAPLQPATVYAPSHPGSISFHPNGRYAYVSSSHGAICQFRIVPTGQLEPLQPAVVYGEDNPSELRFSRWGAYALVVAARRQISNTGEVGDIADDDAGYVYRVNEDGTLTLVRQAPGRNYGLAATTVTVRWSGPGRRRAMRRRRQPARSRRYRNSFGANSPR